MKTLKYANTGTAIQVAGMDAANAQTKGANVDTTAFSSDKIVEVQLASATGGWLMIGTNPTAAADTGCYIPPLGITRPFILKAGDKVTCTQKFNLRTLDD